MGEGLVSEGAERDPGRSLDRVGASMYLSEVRDLVVGLSGTIVRLRDAGHEWVRLRAISSEEANAPAAQFDTERFNDALLESGNIQGDAFELVETLLSRWARLSLLLHPTPGRDENSDWRVERGRLLRLLVDLPSDTLLSKRDVRDSWMHFDERLDLAYRGGWLGNRQQFTDIRGVDAATRVSVRVVDMESGAIHYRTRDGTIASVTLADMEKALSLTTIGLSSVSKRMSQLPTRDRRVAGA